MASISVVNVYSSSRLMFALPRTFFSDVFVSPINLSQNLPYHGACSGMNFHSMPQLVNSVAKFSELKSCIGSSVADW